MRKVSLDNCTWTLSASFWPSIRPRNPVFTWQVNKKKKIEFKIWQLLNLLIQDSRSSFNDADFFRYFSCVERLLKLLTEKKSSTCTSVVKMYTGRQLCFNMVGYSLYSSSISAAAGPTNLVFLLLPWPSMYICIQHYTESRNFPLYIPLNIQLTSF